MRTEMTKQEWDKACIYANDQLAQWQVDEALHFIGNHSPMPAETSDTITDAMDEWCEDHDIDRDAWLEWGCEEDVFFNVE